MKQIIKDAPLYLNGFVVGLLLSRSAKVGFFELSLAAVAAITMVWYGNRERANERKAVREKIDSLY